MKWYMFRHYATITLRAGIIAAICHFLFKTSKPHFALVTSLFIVQELFTWMNIRYQQKKTDRFVNELNELSETLQIENMSKENWN